MKQKQILFESRSAIVTKEGSLGPACQLDM
jgi:hypothetical protein